MKIYLQQNVYEAAIERFERLFAEFDNVIITNSGGKDSTVIMELCLQVAERLGRTPIKMVFIDQECEFRMVIEYMRIAMTDKRVDPIWIQCPLKIPNSLSQSDPWLNAWGIGEDWMRPQEPISIKENIFGFTEWSSGLNSVFNSIIAYYHPNEKACFVSGVRAEESPTRLAALTTAATYKDITWGKVLDKKVGHYTFYPIWDWTVSDVWKAIHNNKWNYCKIYDELYRYGIPIKRMRVSSLNHEMAVHSLFYLQEIERDTWEALVKRSNGINQTSHIKKNEMMAVSELPWMFKDWKEYRDHLTENLITDEEWREAFRKKWKQMDDLYDEMNHQDELIKAQIKSILVNDNEFVKLENYLNTPQIIVYRQWKLGKLGDRIRGKEHLKYIKPMYHHQIRTS
jgi:predicted phosphoadenosine phosphosulfate sulfurtransferase